MGSTIPRPGGITSPLLRYRMEVRTNQLPTYQARPDHEMRIAFIDHNDTIESARHGASSLRYTAMHDLIAGTTAYQSFVTSALRNAVTATPARQDVTGPPTGSVFGIGM